MMLHKQPLEDSKTGRLQFPCKVPFITISTSIKCWKTPRSVTCIYGILPPLRYAPDMWLKSAGILL